MDTPKQKKAIFLVAGVTLVILAGGIWLFLKALQTLDGPISANPQAKQNQTADTSTSTNRSAGTNARVKGSSSKETDSNHPFAEIAVSGRVYDKRTSRGIREALVTITVLSGNSLLQPNQEDGRLTVTTDEAGYYVAKGIPPGAFEFRAEASGYVPATVRIRKFGVVEDDKGIDISMQKAIIIEGRVLGENDEPIASANIITRHARQKRYLMASNAAAKSDENGRFVIDPASKTTNALFVSHPNYAEQLVSLEDQNSPVRKVEVRLKRGRTIRGQVTGPQGPISGAKVSFEFLRLQGQSLFLHGGTESGTAISGPDGTYTLQAPGGKKQGLKVLAEGYRKEKKNVMLEPSKDKDTVVNFELTPARTVTGQVKLQDGTEAANARIAMRTAVNGEEEGRAGGAALGKTDQDGNFVLTGLSGEPPFHVYIDAYGQPAFFDVVEQVDRPLLFVLKAGAKISGQLVDSQTSEAITVFNYSISGACGRRARGQGSSPSGQFVIDGLSAGNCNLMFQAKGYADKNLPPMELIAEEQRSQLMIKMDPGSSIWGQVKGLKAGQKIFVFARKQNAQVAQRRRVAMVEQDFSFKFEDLSPGLYLVNIQGHAEKYEVQLSAGETKDGLEIEYIP